MRPMNDAKVHLLPGLPEDLHSMLKLGRLRLTMARPGGSFSGGYALDGPFRWA
jgi:hypothetical protein